MFYSPPAIKAARRNIKTLEAADRVAIKKIKSQKYKDILGKQERQLHHYLSEYTNPEYLPKAIAKEYEFPKYFYYTVKSKKYGDVQKRTRIDSKLFKRFMGNKQKREQAKSQGLFNITNAPIKVNIDMIAPTTPKPKKQQPSSMRNILGNVGFGDDDPDKPKRYKYDYRYEDTGPVRLQEVDILELFKKNPKIAQELSDIDEDELFDFLYNATKTKKKGPSLKILPFEGEELIETMPSQASTKKNITITKKVPKSASKNSIPLKYLENDKDGSNRVVLKNNFIMTIRPHAPDNAPRDSDVLELIRRREVIDNNMQKFQEESDPEKERWILYDIQNDIRGYNMLYDILSRSWPKAKKEKKKK
jgi:hypothetical protein